MNQSDILLLEYTEIMLGNKRHFTEDYFSGNSAMSEARAISFIRLVFKVYLQCDSLQQVKNIFCLDLIKRMKLTNVVNEIRVPEYIEACDRVDFIAARVFSKNLDPERWAAERYCNRILDGSLFKFPRNYMDGDAGYGRACYCLRYFLRLEKPGATALDLLYYSTTSDFRLWLQDRLLSNVCAKYFETRVDYMYDSLPDDMKFDILYMICKTKVLLDKAPSVIQR